MFKNLKELIKTFVASHRLLLGFGLIVIVLSVSIWKIADNYFIHPLRPPTKVLVSNIGTNSAVINYLTQIPVKTCVIWYSFWPISLNITCDQIESKLHRIAAENLNSNTSYHWFITSGLRIWNRAEQPLVVFQTKSKDYKLDQSKLITFTGRVLDQEGNLQSGATVTLSKSGEDIYWSSLTNAQGNFSLTVSDISLLDQVAISAWSEDGFISQNQSVISLSHEPVTLIVQPYE